MKRLQTSKTALYWKKIHKEGKKKPLQNISVSLRKETIEVLHTIFIFQKVHSGISHLWPLIDF